ncbi:YbaB/EbfC family nucleoid-associated protein [Amycolatopsis sp. NPDC059090]|uniref:YbaB/EbfC family nucleoid-associated protein n=1 Tax=Amycolatopsis sp. NPDC059090 TaxID=3346723 RepID=UPI003672A927
MSVDWGSLGGDAQKGLEDAVAALEAERRKLGEIGKLWDEASTTVRAKDRSLEMTFDGRGELVELTFNGDRYRKLAPQQLASVILETLRKGRAQAQEKLAGAMGGGVGIPGLDIEGVAAGKVRPDEMFQSLLGPMLEGLGGMGLGVDVDSLAKRPGPKSARDGDDV